MVVAEEGWQGQKQRLGPTRKSHPRVFFSHYLFLLKGRQPTCIRRPCLYRPYSLSDCSQQAKYCGWPPETPAASCMPTLSSTPGIHRLALHRQRRGTAASLATCYPCTVATVERPSSCLVIYSRRASYPVKLVTVRGRGLWVEGGKVAKKLCCTMRDFFLNLRYISFLYWTDTFYEKRFKPAHNSPIPLPQIIPELLQSNTCLMFRWSFHCQFANRPVNVTAQFFSRKFCSSRKKSKKKIRKSVFFSQPHISVDNGTAAQSLQAQRYSHSMSDLTGSRDAEGVFVEVEERVLCIKKKLSLWFVCVCLL